MNIIELKNITKAYKLGETSVPVLHGINLSIAQNEFVALMGPSGSGKSTLMNILGGLDAPSSGQYFINNQEISTVTGNQLASIRNKEIGFVFQSFNLLPRLTALENVALPLVYAGYSKAVRLQKASEKLAAVDLLERQHHRPNELSGGQNQRVAIARALVNSPAIILADEPTGNLDSKTSKEIMNLFEHIHQQGNTVILVTHEEDIAQHAHRVIRLKDGIIAEDIRLKS